MSDKGNKESSFINRWSDRKTAERDDQSLEQVEIPEQSAVASSSEQGVTSDENITVPDDLPDINTLDKNSDFSLFMREGTPEHLKKLALKKLFTSDPAFSVLDGLNDYDEDYSMIGKVAEAVSSRYKPGKGMADPDGEIQEEDNNIPEDHSEISNEDQSGLPVQENTEESSEDPIEDAEVQGFDKVDTDTIK